MIRLSPKRTVLLLKIRRAVVREVQIAKPNWPIETVQLEATKHMKQVSKAPIRQLRQVARGL